MRYVIDGSRDKIIDSNDFMAAGQKEIGEMRAEETGGASDDARRLG
jgi:hypothetical protein